MVEQTKADREKGGRRKERMKERGIMRVKRSKRDGPNAPRLVEQTEADREKRGRRKERMKERGIMRVKRRGYNM